MNMNETGGRGSGPLTCASSQASNAAISISYASSAAPAVPAVISAELARGNVGAPDGAPVPEQPTAANATRHSSRSAAPTIPFVSTTTPRLLSLT